MRYFQFGYKIAANSGAGDEFGSFAVKAKVFPPLELLQKQGSLTLTKKHGIYRDPDKIIIVSMFEFKNKKDYKSFNGKKSE